LPKAHGDPQSPNPNTSKISMRKRMKAQLVPPDSADTSPPIASPPEARLAHLRHPMSASEGRLHNLRSDYGVHSYGRDEDVNHAAG